MLILMSCVTGTRRTLLKVAGLGAGPNFGIELHDYVRTRLISKGAGAMSHSALCIRLRVLIAAES